MVNQASLFSALNTSIAAASSVRRAFLRSAPSLPALTSCYRSSSALSEAIDILQVATHFHCDFLKYVVAEYLAERTLSPQKLDLADITRLFDPFQADSVAPTSL
jgi:hypothetical protein